MRSPLCCRVINYRWSSPSYLTLYLRGQHLQLLIPFSREQHAKDTPRDADLTDSVMCTLVVRTGFEPVIRSITVSSGIRTPIDKTVPAPDYLVAGTGIEPATSRLWAWRATAALPHNIVGDSGLEPLKPEGEGFTVPCNCHYANLPFVPPKGFEPLTHRLEICCSILLSYEGVFFPVCQRAVCLDWHSLISDKFP